MFSFEQSSVPLFDLVDTPLVPEQKIVSTTYKTMVKSEPTPLFPIGAPISSAKSPVAMTPMEWESGLIDPTWITEQPTSNFLAQGITTLENSISHDFESDAMTNFFNFDAASRLE
jgi:hypothetical protein